MLLSPKSPQRIWLNVGLNSLPTKVVFHPFVVFVHCLVSEKREK